MGHHDALNLINNVPEVYNKTANEKEMLRNSP